MDDALQRRRLVKQRVDCELTKLGRSLQTAVVPLGSWAQSHIADISKAQDKFAKKAKS
jgi:DNA-binding HxlR family transcriptional regulator